MLKTICIKSNNEQVNNYIIDNVKKFELSDIYLSVHNFSLYTNIIVHYKGSNYNKFIKEFANLLTTVTIKFYNVYLIKYLINNNYFYFSDFDKDKILEYCKENCLEENFCSKREFVLNAAFKNFLLNNKKIILKGFIDFGLKAYLELLDEIVNQSVNNYLIEKEYIEFVDLLKCYVNSKPPVADKIYLIYEDHNSTLVDENGDDILIDSNIKNQYLSDITFSQNDYCLNTLLTLLPRELIINRIDSSKDDFLNTLELIFEDRILYS